MKNSKLGKWLSVTLCALFILGAVAGCKPGDGSSSDSSQTTAGGSDISSVDANNDFEEVSDAPGADASNTDSVDANNDFEKVSSTGGVGASTTSSKGNGKTSSVGTASMKDEVDITSNSQNIYDKIRGTTVRVPIFGEPDAMAKAREKGFEATYGCELVYEVYGWNEWQTKLIQMVSAKTAPDLTPVFQTQFVQYASRDVIQPIDSYIDKNDPVWDQQILKAFNWGGKQYCAAGSNNNTIFFYYNKNILRKAGYDPLKTYQEGNWTWDTFREMAKKATLDSNKDGKFEQYGFATWIWDVFSLSAGGQGVVLNSKGGIDITLDQPNELAGMDFIRKLWHEDKSYAPWENWDSLWKGGKVAFAAERPWNAVGVFDLYNKASFEIGIVPVPKQDKNAKEYAPSIIESYGVPLSAKNPAGGMAYVNYTIAFTKANENTATAIAQRRQTLSDEHQAFVDKYMKTAQLNYSYIEGVGNWSTKKWVLWGEIFENNSTAKSAVEKTRGSLQNEINQCLK